MSPLKWYAFASETYRSNSEIISLHDCLGHLLEQNIVGLDNGLTPDQHQAITQRICKIYPFSD